jgi:TolA-binding protein
MAKIKKERIAYGLFHDGLNLKIAQLALIDNELKIQRLEETDLTSSLYEASSTSIREIHDTLDDEIAVPEISDFGDEGFNLTDLSDDDSVGETFTDDHESSELPGFRDFQNLIESFPLDNGKIGINANDEKVSYTKFDSDFTKSKIRKTLKSQLITKQEQKQKNYQYDYIKNNDKSGLAFVHRGNHEILDALHEINPVLTKAKYFYSSIETNEIALMNLIRNNYDYPEDEYLLIIYIGTDYKVGIVMKGKDHVKTFPIIITDTDPVKIRQAIYSKVILEQDVSDVAITQNVIFAGEYVTDDDIDFFKDQSHAGDTVHRLQLLNIDIADEALGNITPEKVAQFAVPISLAWKVLQPNNKNFFRANLLPSFITERQKHFKVAWHGFAILIALFAFALMGTTKHLELKQQVTRTKQLILKTDAELMQNRQLIAKLNQVKSELDVLKNRLDKIKLLTRDKNQLHYILSNVSKSFMNNRISWVNVLMSRAETFDLEGFSSKRRNIIEFSKLFPMGKINSISQMYIEELAVWEFVMEFSFPNPIQKMEEEFFNTAKSQNNPPEEIIPEKVVPEEIIPEIIPENETVIEQPEIIQPEEQVIIEQEPAPVYEPQIIDNSGKHNVRDMFDEITALYQDRRYNEVKEKCSDFLKQFPKHKLAYDVNYYFGAGLYGTKQYYKARKYFLETINENLHKTPEALIMYGNCLYKGNDHSKARLSWNTLLESFPEHRLSGLAKLKLKKLKG